MKKTNERIVSNTHGITLIALIITIVILIILSTVTIKIAFSDNGLIKRAEQVKNLTEQVTREEQEQIESITDELANILSEDNNQQVENTNVYVTLYSDGTLGFSNNEEKIEGLTYDKSWDITNQNFSIEWNLDEEPYYRATTPWFDDREKITKVVFVNEVIPKSVAGLFMGCTNLSTIEKIENLNTKDVESLQAMFTDCTKLINLDVSNFNTGNVTDMRAMFYNCSALTEILVGPEWVDEQANKTDMFTGCGVDHVTHTTV